MQRVKLWLVPLVLGISVLACNFSPSLASPTPAPTLAEPTQPPATSAATVAAPEATGVPTAAAQATGAATALDPCQVVPLDEASALAGTAYSEGKESTYPDSGPSCVYGAVSANVLTIVVNQAADAAAAKASRDAFLDSLNTWSEQLTGNGIDIVEVSDFADGAIQGQMHVSDQGHILNGSAFAFVKGTTCFGIMDIVTGADAPSLGALQAEATKALDRIP